MNNIKTFTIYHVLFIKRLLHFGDVSEASQEKFDAFSITEDKLEPTNVCLFEEYV